MIELNSFAARLSREGMFDGTNFALHNLRTALEEETVCWENPNSNVSVASEWIIKNGLQLYFKSQNTVLLDEPQMQMTESLYDGPSGLCLKRWQFWKERFSEVMDEVDEEAAKMAQRAIDQMEWIEKNFEKA